jgi:hypothetical protein
VVGLGYRDEQCVRLGDRAFERDDRTGFAGFFDILVVQRHVRQVEGLDHQSRGRNLSGCPDQAAVAGGPPQAARQA